MSGRPKRDVQLQTTSNHQNTPANAQAERESEIPNSVSPLSKARKSARADLGWEETSFKLAMEGSNACTRSQILWQRIPYCWSGIAERAFAYFSSNVWHF